LNLPPERITIVRNPVDEKRFTSDGEKALSSGSRPRVLFVGRLEARKGVHFLMEAVGKVRRECPQAHFLCIGSDTMKGARHGSVLAELKQSLAQNGCEDAVTFIQHVPLNELPAYYRSADICVLPSLYENAPMTAIEAMSCGRPLVASSAGGTKEYVIDNECGLIVPAGNSDALADALIKLIKDEKLREQLGCAARKRVEEALTLDKMAQDSLAVYEAARQTFARRPSPAFYTGAPENLRDDLSSLVGTLEKRLYDMMFTHSLRFRLRHWQRKASQIFLGKR
jgi:glycosyltransferase involved in cell wall biosynthesis